MSLVRFDPCIVTVKHSLIFIVNFQISTSTLFYLNLKYIGTGLQLASLFEAARLHNLLQTRQIQRN